MKQESPAKPGVYMADHPNRYTCGLTGTMYYKVDKSGNRLPDPKQNQVKKEKVVVKQEVKGKKKGKKGKRRKGKGKSKCGVGRNGFKGGDQVRERTVCRMRRGHEHRGQTTLELGATGTARALQRLFLTLTA